MINLETLDLSYNDLHGLIPSSFNQLTFLSKFSVANNHLEGAIPTGGQFLSFSSSSFEGNPGICGKLISPCAVNNVGLQKPTPSRADILAVLLLRISRRDAGVPIEDAEEENHIFSDAFGPPKLVIFKNADCKDLTFTDLLKSTNNFNQSNIIGCGGFGLVYKADLSMARKLQSRGFRGIVDRWNANFKPKLKPSRELSIKTSFLCKGTALGLLAARKSRRGSFLNWDTRLRIAQGSARGLAYLHKEPNIVHRDIKTSNILLDEKFEAHLADFGLSRLLHPYDTHVTTDLVGTLGYIPPEYGQTLTATFRGDVYSFGIVLLELITGRRPVEVCKGKNCRDVVGWVYQMKSERREVEIFDSSIRDKDCEKQVMELLGIACKCIDQDPRRRPSIDEIVSFLEAIEIGKP
ncbi:hypothetical protein DH2020_033475 [Rehmannia glutinosa]|uniref:Protein kinase domain-containing protein n=1 Tax=Rehmannia glutinosa TaxID=99300 RepID=A0ABR0VC88_REHGL